MYVVFWSHKIVNKQSGFNRGTVKAKMKEFTDIDKATKFEDRMRKLAFEGETYQQGQVMTVGNNFNHAMHRKLKTLKED